MTQLQLQGFAESLGLACVGATVAGTWNGYPFMATLRPGQLNVLSVSFSYLRGPTAKPLKQLRKALPRGCALSWGQNRVMMVVSARDEQLAGLFRAGMDLVTGELRACGTTLSDACPLCRQKGCDGYAIVGGGYVPVHQHCCQSRSGDTVARAALNNLNGNYLTGWIGALLGAVVGLIPTLLLAWFANLISAWLCALVPLGAYYGYKLLRGKMDRMATVATVIASLLQVFVLEQALNYLYIVRYMGLWPSVSAAVRYYFEINEIGDMVVGMIQPLIFIVLGIVIVGGIIKRTNQNDTVDAGAMLGSLTDLSGKPVQPVQPAYAARPQYQGYQQVPPQPGQSTGAYGQYQTPPVQQTAPVYQSTYQPAQPAQSVQPVQPAQSVQPERPSQTAWGQAPAQWDRPVEPPAQPEPPAAPTVQAPPPVPDVEPLNIQMPELPDLPETPRLDDTEQ